MPRYDDSNESQEIDRLKVQTLSEVGCSIYEISRNTGRSKTFVKKWRKLARYKTKPKCGRPKVVTRRQRKKILSMVDRKCCSVRKIKRKINSKKKKLNEIHHLLQFTEF